MKYNFKLVDFGGNKPPSEVYYLPRTVLVEGGDYFMGYLPDRDGDDTNMLNSKPSRKESVDSFEIGMFPVTIEEYVEFLNSYIEVFHEIDVSVNERISSYININGIGIFNVKDTYHYPERIAKHPIRRVTQVGAKAYCEWLSDKTGDTYRLPKEVEWEYAARGGKLSKGYMYAGSNDIGEVSWQVLTYDYKYETGAKKPNELGIHDMSGFVWQWCSDIDLSFFSMATSDYYKNFFVVRGGSLTDPSSFNRIASKEYFNQDEKRVNVGFRVLKEVK